LRQSPGGSARSPSPRACVASKPVSASPAKRNGCTRSQPKAFTLYRVSNRRRDIPNNLSGGVVVHNGFKSYGALAGASHAPSHELCNARHLRELKALIEFDKEPSAAAMCDLLLDANRAVGQAKAQGERALDAALLKRFDTRFWETLRERLAFHRKLPRPPKPAKGRPKRSRERTCCAGCISSRTTSRTSSSTLTSLSPTTSTQTGAAHDEGEE